MTCEHSWIERGSCRVWFDENQYVDLNITRWYCDSNRAHSLRITQYSSLNRNTNTLHDIHWFVGHRRAPGLMCGLSLPPHTCAHWYSWAWPIESRQPAQHPTHTWWRWSWDSTISHVWLNTQPIRIPLGLTPQKAVLLSLVFAVVKDEWSKSKIITLMKQWKYE